MKSTYFALSLALAIWAFKGYSKDTKTGSTNSAKTVEMKVTTQGFEPSTITVDAEAPITLKVTRETDQTCAKDISFPKLNIKKQLPLNTPVLVDLGKMKKGQELSFSCGMNMLKGAVVVH